MGFTDDLKRAWTAGGRDNISILAAGISYYVFLAIVPLLAAAVLGYGLVADPELVAQHIADLAQSLPASAAELIGGQLEAVVETSGSTKGLGLLLALALALFGARNAAASAVTAIAMAYEDEGQRSFVRANLFALAITLAGLLGMGLVVLALAATAALAGILPELSGLGRFIGQLASYLILGAAGTAGIAFLYRRSPPAMQPGWRQVLPGAIVSSVAIMALTALFGYYVANFGNYNATYGSLGAVVVLLTWLYLSAYAVLFGAEIAAVRGR
ncbi:MAG: YihY/virulence factor BrkB family protein [Erythrobacter sp.]|nr:MAG: YihY/virulence factor BrkB family protein [Erythrobacter sp.]